MKKSFKLPESRVFRLFSTFLKQNGAYDSFMRNLSKSRAISCFGSQGTPLYEPFEDVPPSCYILFAFRWVSTSEGVNYWGDLNLKWKNVLDLFNF